jgi:hypothetical protein
MKSSASRIVVTALITLACVCSFGQEWVRPYEAGLRNAKDGKWADARTNFLAAIAARSDDTMKASQIGGSLADRRPWREGAPYSPNFAAAYCSFKLAGEATEIPARKAHLADAISGFSGLVEKGQESAESLLFLAATYSASGDAKTASKLQDRLAALDLAKAFKVDREMLASEDLRTLQSVTLPTTSTSGPEGLPVVGVGTKGGIVPALDYKFALIIGTSTGLGQPFSTNSAEAVKDALVKHAGYSEDNIVLIKDGTAAAIMQQARELAEKVADSGTVFVFYSGQGYFDPKSSHDYLAAADSTDADSFDKMVSKTALIQPFISKGCSIFMFFESDRPLTENNCFGREIPQVGRIALCQGNSPGERAYATVQDGKPIGIYGAALVDVLGQTRNNRINLTDFVWNTFYKIRRGTAEVGGGAQTPTLPILVSMTTSVKF